MPLLMAGARLEPGISRQQASAEVAAIGAATPAGASVDRGPHRASAAGDRRDVAASGFVWSVEAASPIPYGVRPLVAGFLGLLMALVSTVLAIACANLAGVLLSRAVTRRQEMAVRTALGGGRRRLIRQLFTETLLLFAMGGAAGLLVARGLLRILAGLLPVYQVPVNLSAPLDGRVVAFALGLSFVAAMLSGLAPALHGSRADVVTALKDDTSGADGSPAAAAGVRRRADRVQHPARRGGHAPRARPRSAGVDRARVRSEGRRHGLLRSVAGGLHRRHRPGLCQAAPGRRARAAQTSRTRRSPTTRPSRGAESLGSVPVPGPPDVQDAHFSLDARRARVLPHCSDARARRGVTSPTPISRAPSR